MEVELTKNNLQALTDDIVELLIKKNDDYGAASFDLGLNGNMVHLWDKVKRYRNLIEKLQEKKEPNFESIEDTLRDIVGYALIGLLILEEDKKQQD